MKKLFAILLILPFMFSCSSDDKERLIEPTQDYTSFVFAQKVDNVLPNCIAAYLDADKHYIKIADLGTIEPNKESKEIKLENKDIKSIYLFTDYNGVIRVDKTFEVKSNTKNIFILTSEVGGIRVEDKKDSTQYPQ